MLGMFTVFFDRLEKRKFYRCPGCSLLVSLNDQNCNHCGHIFSETDHESMQSSLAAAENRQKLTTVVWLLVFVFSAIDLGIVITR
jgi:hypothetical protein